MIHICPVLKLMSRDPKYSSTYLGTELKEHLLVTQSDPPGKNKFMSPRPGTLSSGYYSTNCSVAVRPVSLRLVVLQTRS